MSALGEAMSSLESAFRAVGARWYLFGAQAVAVRGAPRATQDIDVTVSLPRRDLPRLVAELASRGVEHRYPEIADELVHRGSVLPMVHRSGLEVDVVLAEGGLEEFFLSRAEVVSVAGVAVPVASATDLVVMKILAGRGKDLDDVRGLLASGRVDLEVVRALVMDLEAALGQSDLLGVWEGLVREMRLR